MKRETFCLFDVKVSTTFAKAGEVKDVVAHNAVDFAKIR
jgi:hypothetical protein